MLTVFFFGGWQIPYVSMSGIEVPLLGISFIFADLEFVKNNDWAFGWKTSMDQWNDAAVYTDINSFMMPMPMPPPGGPWSDMDYPVGHALQNQRLDLAFQAYQFALDAVSLTGATQVCGVRT